MFGKRFERELKMIDSALTNEQNLEDLKEYFTSFVESVVDKYIADNNIIGVPREELMQAGWTHFHLALKRYRDRAYMMLKAKNDVYYFATYFNWYIRQGIIEYLNSRK